MSGTVVLDSVDREILRLLQVDGRITNRDLAAAVRVDPAAIGIPLQAFLAVRVGTHHRHQTDSFVNDVLTLPYTRAVYLVAGPDDYLVHVTATDVADLQRAAVEGLTERPEVISVRTNLIFQAWPGRPLLPST